MVDIIICPWLTHSTYYLLLLSFTGWSLLPILAQAATQRRIYKRTRGKKAKGLCITFLHTNVAVGNNINLLSREKPEISFTGLKSRFWQGFFPLKTVGENLFLAFSSFQGLLPFLGLQPHHTDFCFYCHISFFDSPPFFQEDYCCYKLDPSR